MKDESVAVPSHITPQEYLDSIISVDAKKALQTRCILDFPRPTSAKDLEIVSSQPFSSLDPNFKKSFVALMQMALDSPPRPIDYLLQRLQEVAALDGMVLDGPIPKSDMEWINELVQLYSTPSVGICLWSSFLIESLI